MTGRQRSVRQGVTVAALAFGLVWTTQAQSPDRLVYADFESVADDGRPVSSRGGHMQLFGYSENPTRPPVFKGY